MSGHHVYHTTLHLPGAEMQSRIAVRAQIAITAYTPPKRGSWHAPPVPAEYAIEIRDEHGHPRPDWFAAIEYETGRRLTEEAATDWQATIDAELRDAAADFAELDSHNRFTGRKTA